MSVKPKEYIGTAKKTFLGDGFKCSICMDKIPERAYKVSGSGRKYMNFILMKDEETGDYCIYTKNKKV